MSNKNNNNNSNNSNEYSLKSWKINNNQSFHKMVEIASGSGAGIITSLVTTPLDVLKTTLQVSGSGISSGSISNQSRGVISTFNHLLKQGGIASLYAGLVPTLVGSVTTWSIYFSSYSYLKNELSSRLAIDINSPALHIMSAMAAGANTSFLTSPIWVIKTRLITQQMDGRQRLYNGVIGSFVSIIKDEGVLALYKGLGPSLLGTLHVGVQFPLYEKLKLTLQKKRNKQELGLVDIVLASSLSKIVASVVAYPHEVIRSRLQDSSPHSPNKYHGVFNTLKRIVNEEGVVALYKGMGINLFRVTPACAITFTSYELIKRYLLHEEENHLTQSKGITNQNNNQNNTNTNNDQNNNNNNNSLNTDTINNRNKPTDDNGKNSSR